MRMTFRILLVLSLKGWDGKVFGGDKPGAWLCENPCQFWHFPQGWGQTAFGRESPHHQPRILVSWMDLSSTKQRHILFYGSQDDGPFVGHSLDMSPPGLQYHSPWPHSLVTDLTGGERSGHRASQHRISSVRVTGRQTDGSHYPRLLQMEWRSVGFFSDANGQVWMAVGMGDRPGGARGGREKKRLVYCLKSMQCFLDSSSH